MRAWALIQTGWSLCYPLGIQEMVTKPTTLHSVPPWIPWWDVCTCAHTVSSQMGQVATDAFLPSCLLGKYMARVGTCLSTAPACSQCCSDWLAGCLVSCQQEHGKPGGWQIPSIPAISMCKIASLSACRSLICLWKWWWPLHFLLYFDKPLRSRNF